MLNRSSSPRRMRAFLQHAPWFTISAVTTATVLGITSLVYFHEEKKPKRPDVVFSMIRTPELPKAPILPRDSEILLEPIPEPSIKPPSEEGSAEPTIEIDPTNFLISEINSTAGGEDEIDGWDGDPKKLVWGNPDGSNFNIMGVGTGSSDKIGGGGTGGGGRRNLISCRTTLGIKPKSGLPVTETLDGLLWLARHQSPDGSWSPSGFSDRCKTDGARCEGTGRDQHAVGVTGLALLAFLGAGFHQQERSTVFDKFLERKVSFRHNVTSGLRWLMDRQREDGALGDVVGEFFYDHAIGAMALCESYAMSPNDLTKEAAKKAIDFLVRHQSSDASGTGFLGWRYLPEKNDSDTSVTGWCVMALKSAELAGLGRYAGAMDGAMSWVRRVSNASFQAGYLSREDIGLKTFATGMNEEFENHPAMTAVAMCVRSFAAHNFEDPALAAGAKALLADLPAVGTASKKLKDYYYWYYGSLALYQFDGPDSPRKDGSLWKRWNEAMLKTLTGEQRKAGAGCALGSWDSDDRWGFAGGRVYATAINTLTLEVYYRYPNAFLGQVKPSVEATTTKKPK